MGSGLINKANLVDGLIRKPGPPYHILEGNSAKASGIVGEVTIITKNKIRGRGRVLKLRFESEQGKDFQLYGYEVINAANSGF